MPIEVGIWRMNGSRLQRISSGVLDTEQRIEQCLERDISVLDPDLLVIGRQVPTDYGKRIDLLAVNAEGGLVVIELKRDRTPRDVVAQLLDYGSWIRRLSYRNVTEIYAEYAQAQGGQFEEHFEEAYAAKFGANPPESLNETHELVVIAVELDAATERIIEYLSEDYGVPINAVFFRYFEDDGREYLARTWLRDPREVVAERVVRHREPWNGSDYYVSFGESQHRNWEDARRFGFVSGGQGRWYSRTLERLDVGARVFVHIPGEGYVGVGDVVEPAQPVRDFTVNYQGETVPILTVPDLKAESMDDNAMDDEKSEYLVGVEWIETVPREEAVWETGMFANQNTACRLRNQFTLTRLTEIFGLEEEQDSE